MIVLGIETSCDETAVGIVNEKGDILADFVLSQLDEHRIYGGVVPEIAARAHLDHLDRLVKAAMDEAGLAFQDIDAVAATCGPGLIGGVMVGMMTGKAIAMAHQKPFIAVNHLEAHVLTPRLTMDVPFPYLVLLVSGGHTQILVAEDVGAYKLLGTTMDDALGECFDKSAKVMGLPYPGGPALEKMAAQCAAPEKAVERFPLPAPLYRRPGCDFSFSGLKTAVLNHVEQLPEGNLDPADIADLSASFQHSVCKVVEDRCQNGIEMYLENFYPEESQRSLGVVGGVAANKAIRLSLEKLAKTHKISIATPPLNLCSDNGVMIAWAGLERYRKNMIDSLSQAARPRWPLEELRQSDYKTA